MITKPTTRNCPNCSAVAKFDEYEASTICEYCGTQIFRSDNDESPYPRSVNIKNLLLRAEKLIEEKHFLEALSYFEKVLDFDVKIHQAWWGIFKLKKNDLFLSNTAFYKICQQWNDVLANRDLPTNEKFQYVVPISSSRFLAAIRAIEYAPREIAAEYNSFLCAYFKVANTPIESRPPKTKTNNYLIVLAVFIGVVLFSSLQTTNTPLSPQNPPEYKLPIMEIQIGCKILNNYQGLLRDYFDGPENSLTISYDAKNGKIFALKYTAKLTKQFALFKDENTDEEKYAIDKTLLYKTQKYKENLETVPGVQVNFTFGYPDNCYVIEISFDLTVINTDANYEKLKAIFPQVMAIIDKAMELSVSDFQKYYSTDSEHIKCAPIKNK